MTDREPVRWDCDVPPIGVAFRIVREHRLQFIEHLDGTFEAVEDACRVIDEVQLL